MPKIDYLSLNFSGDRRNFRNIIQQAEYNLTIGADLLLNDLELKANRIFMRFKYEELLNGLNNSRNNTPALHFFKAKLLIEKSRIYKLIEKMPKGANLHIHHLASVSTDWLVRNLSYTPGLLKCRNRNGITILTFRQKPRKHNCGTFYININNERNKATSTARYDLYISKLLNLHIDTKNFDQLTADEVWIKFQGISITLEDALLFQPVFKSFYEQMLQEMYDNRIMYAEIRLQAQQLYTNDEKESSDLLNNIQELFNIVERFKTTHIDFIDLKIIYAIDRQCNSNELRIQLEKFKQYRSIYPDFIVGLDVMGREDKGSPLRNFFKTLKFTTPQIQFVLHAGETNMFGWESDYNILDAIALDAKRIGNAYALIKHPILLNAIDLRRIAVEICPISNQILKLVQDLRNHPASILFSKNIPIVICNDNPSFWGAHGLSHDFYFTIMSLAPNYSGLQTLKKLILNSIQYSLMSIDDKLLAYKLFDYQWQQFINNLLKITN